ncbi:hypothetical protein SUGI_0788320 [Cryptomeria japonica]|nr:hypothetical protein SUGI_0788320 [Cryptomeria japonica]
MLHRTTNKLLRLGKRADKIGRGFYTSLSSRVKFTRKICASLAQAKPSASGMASTQKKVLVPIGFGTEEMEAVILIDVLRRAGSDVTVASVETDLQIEASRRVKLVADRPISACTEEMFDLIVLPGGMPGSSRLRDSEILENITKRQAADGRLYGAICAAPAVALETWGLLKGLRATCHPSFIDKLSSSLTVGSRVQKDGIVTTSRGPGTAIEFALSFIEQLYGKEKAEEVAKPMVMCTRDGSEVVKHEYNPVEWSFAKTPVVLVPIANGSEEMEAVIIIDVLRRANIHVVVASVEETLEIVASRKVKIVADKLIEEAATSAYDLIVLPGGMPGAERLSNTQSLTKLLREQAESKKAYGAICASPAVVLEAHGLLKEKKATAHPAFSQKLADQSAADTRVVIDGNLITSRGPGTAMEFALAIVEKIFGQEKAISIAEAMVFPYP